MDVEENFPEAAAEDSAAGGGLASVSAVRTRKYFPETFIWDLLNTG